MDWVNAVLATLSEERHRITEPRRKLLRRIVEYRSPFTAEQLFEDAGRSDRSIGRATVYRTLELLQSSGWLARVHREDDEHAYVVSDGRHQHYLVCTACGDATPIEGCDFDAALGGLAKRLGFEVEGHWLEAFGRCGRCRRTVQGPA